MNVKLDYIRHDKFPVMFSVFSIFFNTYENTYEPCLALEYLNDIFTDKIHFSLISNPLVKKYLTDWYNLTCIEHIFFINLFCSNKMIFTLK